MDAQKESCPTKTTLFSTWQNAAEIYSNAVTELSKKIGIVPKWEYEELAKVASRARQRTLEAQATLEAHVEAHGCRGGGDGAKSSAA